MTNFIYELNKVYIVDWVDSFTDNGWLSPEEIEPSFTCTSIGFLVKETNEHITLAGSIDNDGHSNNRISIPKVNLLKVKLIATES